MLLSFYVLKKSGILLYSQQVIMNESLENQPHSLLVAGFFSAIELFAQEFVKRNLDMIEMGEYKLNFSSQNSMDCIFCLVFQKNEEEPKYKYLLNTLKALFINKFKKEIEGNPLNVSPFKKFDPILAMILEAFEIKNETIKLEHFLCGFSGELRDFQSKTGLTCPNCKSALTQLGIDYRIKSV